MAIRKTQLLVNEYYHIYNRGVDKRNIFFDDHDFKRFMALLYVCNGTNPVNMRSFFNKGLPFAEIFNVDKGLELIDIGAHCLMQNHFHLLVKERTDKGISMFMEKLATAYSMYFNKKHERTGGLFEGPFKSKHVDNEPYFNWLFSYIHLNPIKIIDPSWKENDITDLEKTKSFLSGYAYSSYADYFIAKRPESSILNKDAFPEHFSKLNDINNLVYNFTNYSTKYKG